MVDDFRPQQPKEQGQPDNKPDDFQAAYDDKPETYVTPTGEPTTLETAQQETPLAMPKKKRGAGKWLLGGLVVLLLAGLGAFSYWQWTEADSAKKEAASVKQELDTVKTAQKDAANDKPATAPVAPTLTDAEEVTIAAQQFTAARVNNQFNTVDKDTVTIDPTKQFAKAVVGVGTSKEGGYTVIAKKQKDTWVVIYGGVTMTTEQKNNLVKEFGVPESLLANS